MSKSNQEIIDSIVERAKHWAQDERTQIPKTMYPLFLEMEAAYFESFSELCESHPVIFTVGNTLKNLLLSEKIIRDGYRKAIKKNPVRMINRNLAIAVLDTIGFLTQEAIKQIVKAEEKAAGILA